MKEDGELIIEETARRFCSYSYEKVPTCRKCHLHGSPKASCPLAQIRKMMKDVFMFLFEHGHDTVF